MTSVQPIMNSVVLSTNGVLHCTVTVGGTLYTSAPDLSFIGDGTGAAGYCILSGQSVGSIVMTNPGYGYTFAPTPVLTGGGGIDATATSTLGTGFLLRRGYCDFTNDGSFDGYNQSQISLESYLSNDICCFNDPFNKNSSSITKWDGSTWTPIEKTQLEG